MEHPPRPSTSIAILAGGRSRRMGRNKLILKVGGSSLLRRVWDAARETGIPTKIIRKDLIPPCGPLSGIVTAFRKVQSDRILFLAGDMPFVTPELLNALIDLPHPQVPTFSFNGMHVGFPFLLPGQVLARVEESIANQQRSLQRFARGCQSRILVLPHNHDQSLKNINTPEEIDAWNDGPSAGL